MTPNSPTPAEANDDLQFETVEKTDAAMNTAAGEQTCLLCAQPITNTYFALSDKIICPDCAARVQLPPEGMGIGRLFKASALGLGAGLIGAVIWFAIRRLTNMEIGLVAILVGFMVGKSVFKGSHYQGGILYQFLAVVITYVCISANYMPDIFEAVLNPPAENAVAGDNRDADQFARNAGGRAEIPNAEVVPLTVKPQPTSTLAKAITWVITVVLVFALAMALPFLAGMENIIGLLIIGFALWEAWKLNGRRNIVVAGPYQIGPTSAS